MSWDARRRRWPIHETGLPPCCALVRNTRLFRGIVQKIGLSCAELMTRVMRTHGQRHLVVDNALVMHAFGVSYPNDWESTLPAKLARRDAWLARFRQQVREVNVGSGTRRQGSDAGRDRRQRAAVTDEDRHRSP